MTSNFKEKSQKKSNHYQFCIAVIQEIINLAWKIIHRRENYFYKISLQR